MSFILNPLYVAAVLCLLIALAEWLSQKKYFSHIGSALIVILAAAVLANVRLLPSSSNAPPLYDGIFNFVAPLAIFFLLLDVRLRDLRKAGLPMLTFFLIGAACTIAGTLAGYYFLAPPDRGIEQSYAVAGMYTGTYIGGSVNLNAVALQYGVNKGGTQFAAINAADNIITTIWIVATLILPRVLQRWFPRGAATRAAAATEDHVVATAETPPAEETMTLIDLTLLLALGTGTMFVSQLFSQLLPAIPSVLILTTIALGLAQLPAVQRLRGARVLGYFTVLLFLAVVGAYCDIPALIANGSVALTLLAWVTIAVGVHGLLLFTIGGLFKQDWAIVSIASNANVGGATTAGVLAVSIGRHDLRLPGILAGSVGNAIGTYAGVAVAEFLR